MHKGLIRFAKYTLVGGGTFALDLLILALLIDVAHVAPTPAAAIAFLIAITINYAFSRAYVFRGTLRSVGAGYAGFLAVGLSGLLFVVIGMYVLTTVFEWHYLVARVTVATLTGIYNYLLNLYVNFRVSDDNKATSNRANKPAIGSKL